MEVCRPQRRGINWALTALATAAASATNSGPLNASVITYDMTTVPWSTPASFTPNQSAGDPATGFLFTNTINVGTASLSVGTPTGGIANAAGMGGVFVGTGNVLKTSIGGQGSLDPNICRQHG